MFNLVGATYNITDDAIGTIYPRDTYLSGWVEISFENQSLNSIFSDSLNNNVSLKETLSKFSNYSYSCQDNNCEMSYSATGASTTKNFNLNVDEEKFMGIVFTGNIEEIKSINFNLTSDATESEENQIRIDILNDGKIDVGNTKIGIGTSSETNYGCFKDDETLEEINLQENTFCQRIELDEAPAFLIGGWIKEITPEEGANITMGIYNSDGTSPLEECLINKNNIPPEGGEVFCQVNISVAEKEDYYVCVSSDISEGNYKILGYVSTNPENKCGFVGLPVRDEIASYGIGAKTINYGAVETIEILNDLPNGNKISKLVEDYIKDTYGSLDCTGISCYVPIKLISSINQDIDIDSININYDKVGLPGRNLDEFWDFEEKPALINSTSQKLYLDNLFKLPSNTGKIDYKLYFESEKIFDDEIIIEEISMRIYPLIAASSFPITFQVNVNPDFNFSSYIWDFGDGIIETSQGNQKTHTYASVGNYTLNVIAKTEEGSEFSKSFEIVVEIPENMINNAIGELETKIATLKQQIIGFETFEKEQLYKKIDLNEIELKVNYIKEDMKIANEDADYKQIIDRLISIKIPKNIIQSSTNQIFYYPQKNNINLNILEEITNDTSGDAENTLNSILIWNQNNLNSKISMKEILIKWDKIAEPYFKTFELSINMLYTQDEEFYFIIKDIENLDFKGNISMQETSGYKYLPLTEPITLQFSTTEDFDFLTLPMFISPKLAQVRVEEIVLEEDVNRNAILFIILFGLFLIGILIYIILQKWYKTKYEKYLFKEINQLYNVATYIQKAKKNETPESEIRKTLKNAGWNSEQITYALRKYVGKRTGMYEIPIKKLLKKKEAQIKQQQKDTKFNKGYYPK